MKIFWLRYLLVFVCIFSILENTGVSVISLLKKTNICQNDCSVVNDDESAPERNENKETKLKEFYAVQQEHLLPQLYLSGTVIHYADEKSGNHLAWISPVPTPPPNYTV